MSGFNQATVCGFLGDVPVIRRTQSGNPVASMRIATSETWRDKTTGEKKEATEWHSVVVFNEGLCKIVEQYLRKGSRVLVQGQLRTRKWTHQDGGDRWTTEIVLSGFHAQLQLLDRAPGNRPPANDGSAEEDRPGFDVGRQDSSRPGVAARGSGGGRVAMDDEIPF